MVSAIAMQVSKDPIWGKVENALPRIQSNGKSEAKCKLKILDNLLSYTKKCIAKGRYTWKTLRDEGVKS